MRKPKHQKPNDKHPRPKKGALEQFAPSGAEPPTIIDTDPGWKSDPLAEFALDKSEPADGGHEIQSLRIEIRRVRPYFELAAVGAIVLIGALVLQTASAPPPRVEDPVSRSSSNLVGQQASAPAEPLAEAVVPVDAPPPPVEPEEQPPLTAAITVAEPPQPPRAASRPVDRGSSSTSAVPIPTTGAARVEAPRVAPAPVIASIGNVPSSATAAPSVAAPPPATTPPAVATPPASASSATPSPAAPPSTTALTATPSAAIPLAAASSAAVPATATAASPAASPPPPASRVETQRSAVQSVLGRYASAFSTLDASRAKAVWPTVNQRNLERAFDSLEQQQFDLGECDIMVLPPRALALCDGTARYTPKVGHRRARTESRRWTFRLRQNADEWTIENVDSQ